MDQRMRSFLDMALEMIEESEAEDSVPTLGLTDSLLLLLIDQIVDIESMIYHAKDNVINMTVFNPPFETEGEED